MLKKISSWIGLGVIVCIHLLPLTASAGITDMQTETRENRQNAQQTQIDQECRAESNTQPCANGTGTCTYNTTSQTYFCQINPPKITQPAAPIPAIKPNLSIDIPNLTFSNAVATQVGDRLRVSVPFLAEYIAGVYAYAIAIAGVVAGIMILIGGFQYLTAGDSGRVEEAKERISNALIGLFLALASFLILKTVSPKLTELQSLQLPSVQKREIVFSQEDLEDYGDEDSAVPGQKQCDDAASCRSLCDQAICTTTCTNGASLSASAATKSLSACKTTCDNKKWPDFS